MIKQEVKIFNKGQNGLPEYATPLAAGFDLRADFTEKNNKTDFIGESFSFNENDKILYLWSGGRVLIPTGIHIALPDGYELQIRPRSGLALKHGISIVNSPGTIDCVPKGTLIKTVDGYKKVEDIYNSSDKQTILSYNEETTKLEEDIITDMWIVNDLELVKITLDNGKSLIVPISKNVYTKSGWKQISELTENDEILNLC